MKILVENEKFRLVKKGDHILRYEACKDDFGIVFWKCNYSWHETSDIVTLIKKFIVKKEAAAFVAGCKKCYDSLECSGYNIAAQHLENPARSFSWEKAAMEYINENS